MPATAPRQSFFHEACEITSPPAPPLSHFIELERKADDVRETIYRREAERSSGVCMSGMGPDRFVRRSEAQLVRDAQERRDRLVEFRSGRVVSMFRGF